MYSVLNRMLISGAQSFKVSVCQSVSRQFAVGCLGGGGVQCAVCSVQCAVYSVQCALVRCVTGWYAVCSVLFSVCSVQ